MSGRDREEEENPAGKKEGTDHEAQKIQQPSRILTRFFSVSAQVVPGRIHHRAPEPPPKAREPQPPSTPKPLEEEPSPLFEPLSPRLEPLEEQDPTDEPVEEGREKPPDQEDLQKSTTPPAPEGSQNLHDGKYRGDKPLRPIRNELQEREEKDEQDRETGGGRVREQGRDRELSRPPREEVLDRANTFSRPCRIEFSESRPFLKHHRLVHQRKLRTRSGGRSPTPSPKRRGPSRPPTPEPEVSDRSRGRQSGRPEPSAPDQLGG